LIAPRTGPCVKRKLPRVVVSTFFTGGFRMIFSITLVSGTEGPHFPADSCSWRTKNPFSAFYLDCAILVKNFDTISETF